jgi:hypothetical protein
VFGITLACGLIEPTRMRLAVIALLLTACDPPPEDDVYHPFPDAYVSQCGVGAFEIAAPRPDLHYAPLMVVYVNETELQGGLKLTMVDDLGNGYQWTHGDSQPYPGDADIWWNRDSFWYDLAPSRRYTLSVSHGCQSDDQSVTFFTNSQ